MGTRYRVLDHGIDTRGRLRTYVYRNWVCLTCLESDPDSPGGYFSTDTVSSDAADAVRHLIGSQTTGSQNHPAWKHRKRGTFKGDMGGPFSSHRHYVESMITPGYVSGSDMNYSDPWSYRDGNFTIAEFRGCVLPANPRDMEFPPSAASSNEKLDEMGATAISRCAPSSPVADLSVFLGETIREGLPKLIGSSLRKWRGAPASQVRKDLGHEYLNVEFGWKPFVSDLRDICHAITHSDAIWRQYEQDSGKMVRRRYEFPETVTHEYVEVERTHPHLLGPESSTLYNFAKTGLGKCIRHHSVTKRQWFSGAFSYYLPTGESSYGLIDLGLPGRQGVAEHVIKAKKLLGLTLTPDTVWNLSPWSWAVDWFTNTSDVLENWSNWAIDSQVLLYGYFMEHTISSYTYTWTGDTYFRASVIPMSLTTVTETKVRRRAGPYGFGVTWDGLSARQVSIAAALGISRGRQ